MSKDFDTLVDMGITTPEMALRAYAESPSVFFPPHPKWVVEDIVSAFKDYWENKIDEETLAERCHLRSVSGVYKYFEQFLRFRKDSLSEPEIQPKG